ncbi:hypothetical protein I79_004307 [Cricetulus griseus]|uniref:Uncharacterized protein n=1 Tax=Cricetulus griseus TaxID=10029 RepID=G3H261_CRIGR|nr:hypothetical protein I79_004307 [Cricetulus griseus]
MLCLFFDYESCRGRVALDKGFLKGNRLRTSRHPQERLAMLLWFYTAQRKHCSIGTWC